VYDDATASFLIHRQFELPHADLIKNREDAPVDQPVAAFTPALYGAVVYRKGALFFHALRQAMSGQLDNTAACWQPADKAPVQGDTDRFDAFLQTYYRQNKYAVATAPDLLAAAATVLDKSMVQCLYDEWIKGMRQP
jgi:hypothetical protein